MRTGAAYALKAASKSCQRLRKHRPHLSRVFIARGLSHHLVDCDALRYMQHLREIVTPLRLRAPSHLEQTIDYILEVRVVT